MSYPPDTNEIENSEHHSLAEVLAKLRELAGPDAWDEESYAELMEMRR